MARVQLRAGAPRSWPAVSSRSRPPAARGSPRSGTPRCWRLVSRGTLASRSGRHGEPSSRTTSVPERLAGLTSFTGRPPGATAGGQSVLRLSRDTVRWWSIRARAHVVRKSRAREPRRDRHSFLQLRRVRHGGRTERRRMPGNDRQHRRRRRRFDAETISRRAGSTSSARVHGPAAGQRRSQCRSQSRVDEIVHPVRLRAGQRQPHRTWRSLGRSRPARLTPGHRDRHRFRDRLPRSRQGRPLRGGLTRQPHPQRHVAVDPDSHSLRIPCQRLGAVGRLFAKRGGRHRRGLGLLAASPA